MTLIIGLYSPIISNLHVKTHKHSSKLQTIDCFIISISCAELCICTHFLSRKNLFRKIAPLFIPTLGDTLRRTYDKVLKCHTMKVLEKLTSQRVWGGEAVISVTKCQIAEGYIINLD
jgi:hypothetical protein